jgi:hypothetical protein
VTASSTTRLAGWREPTEDTTMIYILLWLLGLPLGLIVLLFLFGIGR